MSEVIALLDRGYAFLKGVFQYSAAVGSLPGYRIERARFYRPLPLEEAFPAIAGHLEKQNRPPTALCACELRSPKPMSEQEFADFNQIYVSRLVKWDIIHDGLNPVARTNVCPEVAPPEKVSCYAFSYTLADADERAPRTFVIAGSGECPEGKNNYRDHIVRLGDQSTDGMRDKARWVLAEMERRMAAFGFGWQDATGTHLYTIYDVHPFLEEDFAARGAMPCGLNWHFTRPPIADLDFEMDVRCVSTEIII
jgi:hypothetical protein